MQKTSSFASRAAVALALTIGFYSLAAALVAGLVGIVYAQFAYFDRFHLGLTIGCLFVAFAIVRAIFFVQTPFEPPGPEITEQDHPRLFATIREVAKEMGAEMPSHVYLAPDVNAFVAEVGGWMGIVGTHRVMGIGLGLLNVDSVAQLRATIAHEFGHFHGGDTKLGGFLYRTRASIGRVLANLDDDENLLMTLLIKPFEGYGNLFLKITQPIMREQELNADAWGVRVAGKRAQIEGLRREMATGHLFGAFLEREVTPLLEHGVAPANLYEGFRAFVANLEEDGELAHVVTALDKAETDRFDTHPSLRERIAFAEALPDPRVAEGEGGSARDLLTDPDLVERTVSRGLLAGATGGPREEVGWETAPAAAYAARMRAASQALGGALDGDDGTVGSLLLALRASDRQALARRIAPDTFRIGGAPPSELTARIVRTVAMARIGEALVASHGYRWDPSPGRHHRVIGPDGAPLDLYDLVEDAMKAASPSAELAERLRAIGIAVGDADAQGARA